MTAAIAHEKYLYPGCPMISLIQTHKMDSLVPHFEVEHAMEKNSIVFAHVLNQTKGKI